MQTLENISTRRSVRSFLPEPVTEEALQTILQATVQAPSGSNAQPWAFVVIQNPKRLAALRALSPGIIDPPVIVVAFCLDRQRIIPPTSAFIEMALIDLGTALQNFLLAAHELGYGACPIGSFNKAGVKSLLHLPDDLEPHLLVTLGRPHHVPPAPPKRPLQEMIFSEKYEVQP